MKILAIILLVLVGIVGALYVLGGRRTRASIDAASVRVSLDSPHGALRLFSDGIQRKDLQAMLSAKDFRFEATELLQQKGATWSQDDTLVTLTEATLRAGFEAEWASRPWPDLTGVTISYSDTISKAPDVVRIDEYIRYPDGTVARSTLYVARREGKWRLVNLPS